MTAMHTVMLAANASITPAKGQPSAIAGGQNRVKLSFDRLLATLGDQQPNTAQESAGDEIVELAPEELLPTSREASILASVLLQPPQLGEPEQQTSDEGTIASLPPPPMLGELSSQSRGQSLDLMLFTNPVSEVEQLQDLADNTSVTARLPELAFGDRPPSSTMADLLAQLGLTETKDGSPTAKQGVGHWGQFERFWLLRSEQESRASVPQLEDVQPEQGGELPLDLGVPESIATGKAESVSAAVDPFASESAEAIPDTNTLAEPLEIDNRLTQNLAMPTSDLPTADVAATREVIHPASPRLPFLQQLEQGLTAGVRQLQLLRSPDGLTLRLQLYPEQLGEVRIELKLEGDRLTAQLRAVQPQAAEALRSELPQLRTNLADQGFTQVFLEAETADFFGQSSGQQQQAFQEQQTRHTQQVVLSISEIATTEPELESRDGRLDYKL